MFSMTMGDVVVIFVTISHIGEIFAATMWPHVLWVTYQEGVKATSTVYECTKYLAYENIIIEKKSTSFLHETVHRGKK